MSRLYVFEGPDGVGKTTVVNEVKNRLCEAGVKCASLSFPGKEPGTLGFHIYKLHHAPDEFGISDITPLSLQLLHVAAHIDSIQRKILPLIEEGVIILLDRYWWSSWAYGIVGGVPRAELKAVLDIEHLVWRNIVPTTVFLLSRAQPSANILLIDAYKELAAQETVNYPICEIRNESSIDMIVEKISQAIIR